jgi:hypothetical protein
MLKQKGTALKATVKYVQEKLDKAARESFIAGLPEGLAGYFRKPAFATEWYPADDMADLMVRLARHTGRPEREVAWEIGRHSSDEGLNTVYKIFIRLGNPEFIIRKAAYVWNTYYSEGVFEVELTPPRRAVLTLKGCRMPHETLCMRVAGWMQRTLEHSGGKNVRVDHAACTLQGRDVEEFIVSWE